MIADAVYSFPSLLLAILMAIIDLPRLVRPVERHLRLRHLHHRGLYSAILPYHPCRSDPHQGIRVRGIRPRGRRLTWRIDRAPVQELHTNPAVILTLNSSEAILTLAGLGFLGFGIEPTAAAEWGYDLNRAVSDVTAGIWWTAVFPGLAIVLIVLGITLVGESLNASGRSASARPEVRRRVVGFHRGRHVPLDPGREPRGKKAAQRGRHPNLSGEEESDREPATTNR